MNFKNSIILIFLLWTLPMFAQPSERQISREEYIETYKEDAIKEMILGGIPASITLAQGMLESANGNSPLARYANNHFGIKCHASWEGPTFIQDDDAKNECFRKYYSAYNSFKDHSDFLKTRGRYSFLFAYRSTDYKSWAHGLKKAGYATNPKYPHLLIKLIEDNELHQYDKVNKMPKMAKKEMVTHIKSKPTVPAISVINVSDNHIKYITAQQGESFYSIAKKQDMGLWQILKYNDYKKGDVLKAGVIIYLQPKRNKSKTKNYTLKANETLHDVSQKYGVKLKKLLKKNPQFTSVFPKKGDVVKLR